MPVSAARPAGLPRGVSRKPAPLGQGATDLGSILKTKGHLGDAKRVEAVQVRDELAHRSG
ncbi:MAG: hypothetical protein CBC48_04865 [bacterium TMED88]|nr:MAG: hypothetical protein CBC48_04865 [bacterium TMED88]